MRQALYRAYRPRTFDEVVGQDAITTILRREMESGRPSHAYLFVGSRGTGKTTCAKLVAKAVNCEHLHDGNPCNECRFCKGVDDGSLLDVTEIDAASNNGVDSIRSLRDEAVFTPTAAKYRVYIIDEVHMLSTSAFNALLKTLEEPPEHVIFVLATTEIQKVLPTIISRCQRFDFRRIDAGVIAGRLKTVCERENLTITEDAAQLIARLADGGMRDALSLLDVCAADTDNITLDTVSAAAGLAGRDHLFKLSELIFSGDTAGVLTLLKELTAKSLEPQRLCEQLIAHLRDLMLVKTVPQPQDLLGCLPSEIAPMQEQGKKITLSDLLSDIAILQEAAARMPRTASKRAELELALVRLTEPTVKTGNAELLRRIERLEQLVANGNFAVAAADDVQKKPSVSAPVKRDNVPAAPKVDAAPAKADNPPAEDKKASDTNAAGMQVFRPWPQVLEAVANANTALAGMMSGTKAYFDGKHVLTVIKNPVLLEMLRKNEYTKKNIRDAIASVIGRSYPIGPYKAPEQTAPQTDPLESLISTLPNDERIQIH